MVSATRAVFPWWTDLQTTRALPALAMANHMARGYLSGEYSVASKNSDTDLPPVIVERQPRSRSQRPEQTMQRPILTLHPARVLVGVTRRLQVAQHGTRRQDGMSVTRPIDHRAIGPRATQKRKDPRDPAVFQRIARVFW